MFDSHAHIVTADTDRFPTVQAVKDRPVAMLSTFPAETLLAQMDACGVARALVVQRGQFYGYDNSYVLASARAQPRLRAVCGVDATRPDCAMTMVGLRDQGAVGFRLMARIGDPGFGWLDGLDDGFWAAAQALAVPICVHFFDWNRAEGLVRLAATLSRHAIGNVVVDHLSNAPITSAHDHGIDGPLRDLVRHAGVALKFTSIPLNSLQARGIDPGVVLGAYLDLVGDTRLVWGSDITQSAGTYPDMVAAGRAAVAHLPAASQDRLLTTNTARIYGD